MLPASNRGAGMNMGFPDVCLTPAPPAPPIPVPYPNIGLNAQALGFSPIVKVSGVNALNMGSSISMTTGDEAGAAHPSIKGMGKYTMGNPIVHIDRLPGINLACLTTGNMMNNPIGMVAVPSAVNVMYCYASGSGTARVGDAELEALSTAMCESAVVAERLPADVALVTVPCFAPGVATDVFRALRRLGDGLVAIVLDLRGNPGGDLHAAIALAADFARCGELVVHLRQTAGDLREVSARAGARYDERLFVLVDRGTASAAELFTAAMKQDGRGTVVGQRTHGKTTAQRIVPGASAHERADVAEWSIGGTVCAGGVSPAVELAPPIPGEPDLWVKTAWALALRRET